MNGTQRIAELEAEVQVPALRTPPIVSAAESAGQVAVTAIVDTGAVAEAAAGICRNLIISVNSSRAAKASRWRIRSYGDLSISLWSFARYLNQSGLESTYTDSFGRTRDLDLRNDLQLQKATLYFKGWLGDPRLRYLAYVWSANTSQGQSAQVVVAGNLTYVFRPGIQPGRRHQRPAHHALHRGQLAELAQGGQPHHRR